MGSARPPIGRSNSAASALARRRNPASVSPTEIISYPVPSSFGGAWCAATCMTAGVCTSAAVERHAESLLFCRIVDAVAPAKLEECCTRKIRRLGDCTGGDKGRSRHDNCRMPAVAGDMDETGARACVFYGQDGLASGEQDDREHDRQPAPKGGRQEIALSPAWCCSNSWVMKQISSHCFALAVSVEASRPAVACRNRRTLCTRQNSLHD